MSNPKKISLNKIIGYFPIIKEKCQGEINQKRMRWMIRIPFLGYEYQERKASEIIIIECNSVLVCNKKRYRNKGGKIKGMFQIN